MKLTEKEEKIARLALDKGAKDGERDAAAKKLIESLYARGVRVEDIQKEEVHTEYVYSDPPPPPRPRRTDAPWDPDPAVRRRNYEAADAAARQWDRQYGYQYSAPPETEEEKAAREEAHRQYCVEQERISQEYRAEQERIGKEEAARARARQAVLDARPLFIKLAAALGALGPYSKSSGYQGWTGNPALEEKIQLIFGSVLLVLIGLAVVTGLIALIFH
jgi:hypothetical protein